MISTGWLSQYALLTFYEIFHYFSTVFRLVSHFLVIHFSFSHHIGNLVLNLLTNLFESLYSGRTLWRISPLTRSLICFSNFVVWASFVNLSWYAFYAWRKEQIRMRLASKRWSQLFSKCPFVLNFGIFLFIQIFNQSTQLPLGWDRELSWPVPVSINSPLLYQFRW